MVHGFADLWFGLVLEIGPLGPVEGDGPSRLQGDKTRDVQPSVGFCCCSIRNQSKECWWSYARLS